mmetsp:Transcript_26312/g.86355  ORF Transcript_26312/g.86355 Transcript_26312/m.86355 type:complete len:236 (-) Transcript_26312:1721-2428(-)
MGTGKATLLRMWSLSDAAATSARRRESASAAVSTSRRPRSGSALVASPTTPSAPRSCAAQPHLTPNPSECVLSAGGGAPSTERSANADGKSFAFRMSTRSGRRWSMTAVSTAPPWMPYASSFAGKSSPAPASARLPATTTSIPSSTRRRRATISATAWLPPCPFTKTSLRTPVRCTLRPMSIQSASSVAGERESVPANSRCSVEVPTGIGGRTSTPSATPGASFPKARVTIPSAW